MTLTGVGAPWIMKECPGAGRRRWRVLAHTSHVVVRRCGLNDVQRNAAAAAAWLAKSGRARWPARRAL